MEDPEKQFDVAGIGSPLLDFIIELDDAALASIGLTKGQMHLVGEEESARIFAKIGDREYTVAPGGSAANTLAGVSALGGRAVFMGKIGADDHGDMYQKMTEHDQVSARLDRHPDARTGHAITFVTPDGERTFATHLGAALHYEKEDVVESDVASSRVLHLEGYQLEDPELLASAMHAMSVAKKHGTKISVDLSDPALILRNLSAFRKLVEEHVDIVFVNDAEAKALTGKDAEGALHEIRAMCEIAVVKQGEAGSMIGALGDVFFIPPHPVVMANTNGAGDMYAGGLLYGLTHGMSFPEAGALASFAAAQVVSTTGARLDARLKNKVKEYMMASIIA